MKKLTITAITTGALLLATGMDALAQEKDGPSGWGSWQLVSNVSNPKTVNVQFYNAAGVLMYEEKVEGRRLNPARRKVCRQLDEALATAYLSWSKNQIATLGGKNLLARRSRGKTGSCTAATPE